MRIFFAELVIVLLDRKPGKYVEGGAYVLRRHILHSSSFLAEPICINLSALKSRKKEIVSIFC